MAAIWFYGSIVLYFLETPTLYELIIDNFSLRLIKLKQVKNTLNAGDFYPDFF